LFIQAIKTANTIILAKIEAQALDWWAYRLLHDQYFKEIELATMLVRTVQWTPNPALYFRATAINMLLWQKAEIARHVASPIRPDLNFFEYLGLSHAFMAEIRFVPLFPPEWDFAQPFLFAINEIEEENGRQIQAQIRLLKDIDAPAVAPADRERIVERQRRIVVDVFAEFLGTVLRAK
ncbi:MAG TPA: hypothetical protein VET85_02460, partial [Stellaceae bacterium]|nr:hypothetical protein [Stellaceae bacterium]